MEKKKKKKKSGKHFFYYFNYKNLIGEIEHYGYVYTWKKMLSAYALTILAAVCAGMLYRLPLYGIAVIALFGICVTPVLILNGYKTSYEQRRFSDVSKYIEKILYYFKNTGKILTSLEDLKKLYPNGAMRDALDRAVSHMKYSITTGDAQAEAFKIIEQDFACERLMFVHDFLLKAERFGGDTTMGIDILLTDRKLWVDRVVELQKKKASVKNTIIISLLITMALCLSVLYLPMLYGNTMANADISGMLIVQLSAIAMIISEILIYIKADKNLCVNWLHTDAVLTREKAYEKYYAVKNFNSAVEFKKSILWALIPAVLTVLAYIGFKSPLVFVPGVIGIVFMLNQHKVGYKYDKKKIVREVEKAFPSWLLQVALLLKSENVRMAIRTSFDSAPPVLLPAIEELLHDLDEFPDSELPYSNFLSDYNLPEVSDVMHTLYSISSGAGGNVDVEFKSIISSVVTLTDKSERLKNEDSVAVMGILVTVPALLGSLKLIVDMSALLLRMLAMRQF